MTIRTRTTTGAGLLLAVLFVCAGCEKSATTTIADDSAKTAQDPARDVSDQPASSKNNAKGAPEVNEAIDGEHQATLRRLIDGGIDYLLARRDRDGGWSLGDDRQYQAAVTAMTLKALVQSPRFTMDSPQVAKGFEVMLRYRQVDGGIYDPRVGNANYFTCLAVMAMTAANDAELLLTIRDAVRFLKGQQMVAGSKAPDGATITEDDPRYGGVSYGRHGQPDLSNVSMWVQALHDAGVSGDDPAIQRALVFVTRTQNRSESNPTAWAATGANDGGFVYAPASADDLMRGESKAGLGPRGRGLRSYGSMTYVGFKSLLYADLKRDDPRVVAAYEWICRYWRLDANANMPPARSRQGLYYYYHAMAKALRAWGRPVIKDAKDRPHNWRHELIDALAERVRQDSSWVNDADRWLEADPVLVTAYAVLTLQEAAKP